MNVLIFTWCKCVQAISRRGSRFKLQVIDRQDARSQGRGDERRKPMAWGLNMDAG